MWGGLLAQIHNRKGMLFFDANDMTNFYAIICPRNVNNNAKTLIASIKKTATRNNADIYIEKPIFRTQLLYVLSKRPDNILQWQKTTYFQLNFIEQFQFVRRNEEEKTINWNWRPCICFNTFFLYYRTIATWRFQWCYFQLNVEGNCEFCSWKIAQIFIVSIFFIACQRRLWCPWNLIHHGRRNLHRPSTNNRFVCDAFFPTTGRGKPLRFVLET